jgi:hypothetical protein
MTEEEKRLIRWNIEDIANTLHALEQRLFYNVEVKMCEHGKPKPGFNRTLVLRILEAKKLIKQADEFLVRATMDKL